MKIYITYCCLLFSTILMAQPIDVLIDELYSNNLELKILENDYLAALQKGPQQAQLENPEIGIGAFPLPVETRLGAQTLRLSATQKLPWFGLLNEKKALENIKAKAVYEQIETKKLELIFQLKTAYYQLYEIEQSQTISQRKISVLGGLERLALTKVESGTAAATDVLRVQLDVVTIKQDLLIWEQEKTGPRTEINRLLNRTLDTPIEVEKELSFAPMLFEKDSLLRSIQLFHPSIKQIEWQQESAQQAIALNHLESKPSFGLGIDYIAVNERTDMVLENNGRDILQLRASVKVPLYRQKYEAKEKEENLRIMALDARKEDIFSAFVADIETSYANYEMAQLKIALYEQQIELTQAAIQMLQTNYSTEGQNFDDLLRLEKQLIDYDLDQLKAIVQSHLEVSAIERYLGMSK